MRKNNLFSKIFVIIFLLSFSFQLNAQNYCATESPEQNKKLEISSLYQQWISDGGMNFIESGIIDIPIAFHIIMRDDGYGNVDDGTIYQQLNIINSRLQPYGFRFTFYSIDRTYNTAWFYHMPNSQEEIEMKNALSINPLQILNFYICHLDSGYVGYAHFPHDFNKAYS